MNNSEKNITWSGAQDINIGDVIRIWEHSKRLFGFVLFSTASKDGLKYSFKVLTIEGIRTVGFHIDHHQIIIANRQTLNGLQSAFG